MTKVVQKFIAERPAGTILIQMTLEDAEHYSPEQRATLIQSYPSYIREARAYGRPSKGSGVVYPVTDESIACDPLPIPSFWRQIGGLDLGGSEEEGHPTAAVKLAHDPEADIVYITATYRKKEGLSTNTLRRCASGGLTSHGHGRQMLYSTSVRAESR
jgi:hypothetical protein